MNYGDMVKFTGTMRCFDLLWYLSQRPPVIPNMLLLQNALDQTQGTGRHMARSWVELVRERLATLDMQTVCNEVSPFLERQQDSSLLTSENLEGLLRGGHRRKNIAGHSSMPLTSRRKRFWASRPKAETS
jgi:hypothetical protein